MTKTNIFLLFDIIFILSSDINEIQILKLLLVSCNWMDAVHKISLFAVSSHKKTYVWTVSYTEA